jgi:hypothetical protein
LATAGYSGYQAKKQLDTANDLGKLADTERDFSLLSFTRDQFTQGLQQSNAVLTAALKQSPNAVASQLAKGYRVPDYLV